MNHIIFGSMSPEAKRFYSYVFNTALLNMYAVRNGLFHVLLCDSEDPLVMLKWREALPQVLKHIIERRARGLGTDD